MHGQAQAKRSIEVLVWFSLRLRFALRLRHGLLATLNSGVELGAGYAQGGQDLKDALWRPLKVQRCVVIALVR